MSRALLHLCFAASGFAGLVWQVLWVRQLGLAFGSTVHAAAIVTAVYLLGLGVGARLGGRVADRAARVTWMYAGCEAAVAAWGVALGPVLVALAASGFGGTTLDAHGWLVPSGLARMAQVLVAIGLLGPPTLLMGASLPLLARPAVGGRLDLAGWRLGVLAAVNTGGAALGALATDLWLVPALGMRGAGGVAAAFGVGSAIGALLVRVPAPGVGPGNVVAPGPSEDAPPSAGAIAIAVALAGFAAMGFEVVWLRFLGSALGPYRAVYSVLLGVILGGWLVGSVVGGALSRRIAAVPLFAGAQAMVVAGALVGLARHDPRALLVRQLALPEAPLDPTPLSPFVLAQHGLNLATAAAVALPAAVAMGVAFPVANALAQTSERHVGRAVGRIWLAVTAGNAAGALLTGLWLLPRLGMQGTALVLGALAAAAPLALARRPLPVALSGAGLLGVAVFAGLPPDTLLWGSFPHGRAQEEGVLAAREGLNETIVVTGRPEGPARLWTNGHPMSATTDRAQRYMRLLAHLPLLAQEAPRRAMVVCFGVGNTLHAASLHPVKQLVLADTSADVLEHAPHFAHANRGVLGDPRVAVHVDDGRHVLRTLAPGTFDLLTLEPPPIAHAGVAALYSREFYALARERLAEGGWLTQWLPAYQVSGPTALALVRAFVDVFPGAVLLVGDGRELLLAGVKGGAPRLDVGAIDARLRALPAVREDLARIGVGSAADLAATFAAGGDTLVAATAGVRPVTDDRPVSESSQVSHVLTTELPAALLAPRGWPAFAPGLAGDPAFAARMADNEARWASEAFRRYSNR